MEQLENGINVLSKHEIMKDNYWMFGIMSILGVLFVIVGFIVFDGYLLGELLGFIGIIIIILLPLTEETVPTGKYIYTVYLDESVSVIGFSTKYEIISQDGLIYEIKLREDK